jgi:hypothetical protein
MGTISVGFEVTEKLLLRFVYIRQILENKAMQRDSTSGIHRLRVRREVLYNILIRVCRTHETS